MPYVFRSNREFCHLIVIIPGPGEPKSVDPYVEELFKDFQKFGPSGDTYCTAPPRNRSESRMRQPDIKLSACSA